MTRAVWDRLLEAARDAHRGHAAVSDFCPFPDDITPQPVKPFPVPAAQLFAHEAGLGDAASTGLHAALLDAAAHATWREIYKGTAIGQDFLDRFGCYCLIGPGGGFTSKVMRAWMVYMPPGLHYTWHHHPAEEMYLVVAGSATFFRHGEQAEVLTAGQTAEHRSNQPHAMETAEAPVLAYVIWRDGFDVLPVLTPSGLMT